MGEKNCILLAQDAAYQSYTGRLTGLWFLSKLAQKLNTINNNNNKYVCVRVCVCMWYDNVVLTSQGTDFVSTTSTFYPVLTFILTLPRK
jgi:hypothetical protein